MEFWDAYDKNGNKLNFDLIRGESIPENCISSIVRYRCAPSRWDIFINAA